MTGRRAVAASDNSKAVNPPPKSMYGYVHEDYILQPVSSSIHPDNCPCFVLNCASVVGKDLKTPVSLLHAELEGPLTIRGLLEVDSDFLHLRECCRPAIYSFHATDGHIRERWQKQTKNNDRGYGGERLFDRHWSSHNLGPWKSWLVRNSASSYV